MLRVHNIIFRITFQTHLTASNTHKKNINSLALVWALNKTTKPEEISYLNLIGKLFGDWQFFVCNDTATTLYWIIYFFFSYLTRFNTNPSHNIFTIILFETSTIYLLCFKCLNTRFDLTVRWFCYDWWFVKRTNIKYLGDF